MRHVQCVPVPDADGAKCGCNHDPEFMEDVVTEAAMFMGVHVLATIKTQYRTPIPDIRTTNFTMRSSYAAYRIPEISPRSRRIPALLFQEVLLQNVLR